MQSISVILDITKVADFRKKNIDISRTQEVCYVIYILSSVKAAPYKLR